MIHYGKSPEGNLHIIISPDEVKEIYEIIQSAGLQQRRTFNGLKEYITLAFADELMKSQKSYTQ